MAKTTLRAISLALYIAEYQQIRTNSRLLYQFFWGLARNSTLEETLKLKTHQ